MCTKSWNQEYDVLLNSNGVPTLAGRRKQLKFCSLSQMMNGQISFPSAPHVLWHIALVLGADGCSQDYIYPCKS